MSKSRNYWIFLLGIVLLTAPQLGDTKKIPKWWMKVAQRQGPNACVVEEVPGTGKEFWTECRYWLNRKICGRKTIVRFECCEGFEQMEGENGCIRVKPLMNLLDTAEALGATRWASYIRESGLANELETAGAYTLFAPTNEAFDSVKASLKSQMESYRGSPSNPILLYHLLPTKLPSDHFEANTVVETRHSGNFLRINKYSNGMNTINCALLLQKDQQATNGIVHVIDSVLDPSKSQSDNVADMVLKDGRFTVLSEMLEKSGYINVLRTMHGSITFLAPSDEAFQKLPDSRREKIINDREARLALIQNHLIPHVICESAITGEHRVRTVSSNKLTFNCDISGAYVETSKLRGNFNLGKNGIIHILDDVLLPDRAKNLVELAESRQLFTFAELVRQAGLEDTLSHTGDYTFFVPDENAWFEVDQSVLQQARRDVEYAGLLLRFHGAYGRHLTNAISDNQAIMSLDEENPVRLQVWRRAMGVEDARITTPDIEAQNGVIHIINKVIFPSNQSATATLRSLPGRQTFNTYLDLLQRATDQVPPVLSLRPGDDSFYTFFAPTDRAFGDLDTQSQAKLRSHDTGFATSIVKKHIAVNMFPFTSFEPNLIYSIEGMDGSNFNIKKDSDGKLFVNGAPVGSSHMSANGVIHVIDNVFLPSISGYGSSSFSSSSSSSHGGSGGSFSSSSSSSSSSGGTTRTTNTYKKRVTFAEGYDEAGVRLPTIPQGSGELASGARGRPPTTATLPSQTSPSSAGSRGSPEPQHANSPVASHGVPSVDESVVDNNPYHDAREHDNSNRYSYTHSSSSSSSSHTNPDYVDREDSTSVNTHEPRLEQWGRDKYNRINNDNEDKTNSETELEQIRIHEETQRRLELARRKEIQRQEQIKRDEEIRRVDEVRRHNESRRQEEVIREEARRREEEIRKQEELRKQEEIRKKQEIREEEQRRQSEIREKERRRELIRQRQEELRRQQDENARIEEENRRRELESRRLEDIRKRHEEQLKIEEENRRRQQESVHGSGDASESTYTTYHSYGSRGREADIDYRLHEPGLLTRAADSHHISPTNMARNNDTFSSSSSSSVTTHLSTINGGTPNTIGPVTPNGTRYSYVGRSYGDDIVGHDSNTIPFTSNGNSGYLNETTTHVRNTNKEQLGGITSNGLTTTTTSRRVNVTRTIYSYPATVVNESGLRSNSFQSRPGRGNNYGNRHSTNFYRQHNFSYPTNGGSAAVGKTASNLVSAYAFTGGDTEFADGQEFVASGAPVLSTVSMNQARALRRQWRRKRHHMLRNKALADQSSTDAGTKLTRRKRIKKGRRKGMRKWQNKAKRQARRRMRVRAKKE